MSLMPTFPPANADRAPLALVPPLPLAGNMPGGPARRAGGGSAPEHRPAPRHDQAVRAGTSTDIAPSPPGGEGRGEGQAAPRREQRQ